MNFTGNNRVWNRNNVKISENIQILKKIHDENQSK